MVSVDSTSCRAHQHAAGAPRRTPGVPKEINASAAPPRRRTKTLPGRPDLQNPGGNKAYSSRRNPRYLPRCQIKHTIPEPKDQRANRRRRGSRGGRSAGFDKEMDKRRSEVERTINPLKHFRAVATRYDKHACVFTGTMTVASTRLWLKP